MTTAGHLVVALVAAHILGDFVFQTRATADRKNKISRLILHTATVSILSYLFSGAWRVWEIPVGVFLTHGLIDYAKIKYGGDGITSFAVDQVAHLAVIVGLASTLKLTPIALFWVSRYGDRATEVFVVTAGVIATTTLAGIVVQKVLKRFQHHHQDETGVLSGGATIGKLERFLIFVLVLAGELGTIGFLIAAKSLLRFGELRDSDEQRKEIEYVIIGTMWSFACGILIALATRNVLHVLH